MVPWIGVESRGGQCQVSIQSDQYGNRLVVDVDGYNFNLLNLTGIESANDGEYVFEDLTMDYGDGKYSTVLGAPITVGKIGLLDVAGKLNIVEGSVLELEMNVWGGLFNWYRRNYRCLDLR